MPINAKTRARNAAGEFLSVHGASATRTHAIWMDMRKRCRHHPRYAGRGIVVCKRWEIFDNFLLDMGEAPPGLSLDRINNDLGYSPENCRWATGKQQSNNRRNSVWLTVGGKTQTIAQWADETGIPYSALHDRIRRNWPIDLVVTVPSGSRLYRLIGKRPSVQNRPRGSAVRGAKLDEQKVLQILTDTRSSRLVALDYGVGHSTILDIRNKKKWTHVGVADGD